ncbi:hypothetical protein [Shouchella lonarensis]|uniref:Chromosome segregation ATPase n=1 Tax=Shouchella lonarensis TaxID=1464122 RepID=A0A1G6NGK2_9BACI|nr:hypothetical protein [Shouchella lonarensis]SDC66841.1 hypothetical protein SAMN05421737_11274 [Shouchella lonarensis]
MPKIDKIRISGLKYNSLKKHYGDLLLDFASGEEAQHTLITLVNGGGKGVFLQTLFQIMLPGTSWGPLNENKQYHHFFKGENGTFHPYTFHVGIQFRLDTVEERYLTIGVVATAEKRELNESDLEKQQSIEEKMVFYKHEHHTETGCSLSHLPFTKDDKVVAFHEFIQFLEEKRMSIHKYERHETFQQNLKTYGVYKKEWTVMRGINKHEGGVQDYFKDSQTNTKLYKEKIIPTISEILGNKQELANMYEIQVSIAEKLPELERRMSTYKAFLNKIDPLMREVQKEEESERNLELEMDYGMMVHKNLNEIIEREEADLTSISNDIDQLKNQQKDLEVKLENVDYAKIHREVSDHQQRIKHLEEKEEKYDQDIITFENKKQTLELDVEIRKYANCKSEVAETERHIKWIRSQKEQKDIQKRMSDIEKDMNLEWEHVQQLFKKTRQSYTDVMWKLNEEQKELKAHQKHKEKELQSIKVELATANREEKKYCTKLKSMEGDYGEKIDLKSKEILEGTIKDLEVQEKQLEKETDELKILKGKSGSLGKEVGRLGGLELSCKGDFNKKKKEAQLRAKKEATMANHIAETLRVDPPQTPSILWFQEMKGQLHKEIEEIEAGIVENQIETWTMKSQQSLNEDDYFIPNLDLKVVARALKERGISAVFGTEYICHLSESEKEDLKNKNPLIRYGLVISKEEWDILNQSKLLNDEVQSLVPIFVRGYFEDIQLSFGYMDDQTKELAFDVSKYQLWKEKIDEKLSRLEGRADEYVQVKKKFMSIVEDLRLLLQETSLEKLNNQLQDLEDSLRKTQHELREASDELNAVNEKQDQKERHVKGLERDIDTKKIEVLRLKDWVQEVHAHNERVKDIEHFLLEERKYENLLRSFSGKIEQMQQKIMKETVDHGAWLSKNNDKIAYYREVLGDIMMPVSEEARDTGETSTYYSENALSSMDNMYRHWSGLKNKQDQYSVELATYNERLNTQQEKVNEIIDILNNMDNGWKERDVPKEEIGQLKSLLDSVLCALNEVKEEKNRVNGKKGFVKGQLSIWIEDLKKAESNLGQKGCEPDPLIGKDLGDLQYMYQAKLDNAKKEINDVSKERESLEKQLQNLRLNQEKVSSRLGKTREIGVYDSGLIHQIESGKAEDIVNAWINKLKLLQEEVANQRNKRKKAYRDFKQIQSVESCDAGLIRKILDSLEEQFSIDSSTSKVIEVISNMKKVAKKEIEKEEQDAKQAMEARSLWTSRALKKFDSIIGHLHKMEKRMTVTNDNGYSFPLIRIDQNNLPGYSEQERIRLRLNHYFDRCMDDLIEKFEVLDTKNNEVKRRIRELVRDENIVEQALGGAFPKFEVYNMDTQNAFQYNKAHSRYFSRWEVINQGDDDITSGSGGQKLSARMIVMMMLLSFKKQGAGDSMWTPLISDNPFGQAISTHILDPIFSVAEKLKFQLLIVCPPELVKVEVSKRFPNYYQLELEKGKKGEKLVISGEEEHVTSSRRIL